VKLIGFLAHRANRTTNGVMCALFFFPEPTRFALSAIFCCSENEPDAQGILLLSTQVVMLSQELKLHLYETDLVVND
jgi:hypothetical protein